MALRKKPYPITQLTGGLDVSVEPIFLIDKASPNLQNCRFQGSIIKKDVGLSNFGTGLPLDGYVRHMDSFPMQAGAIHYLFMTTKFAYRLKGDQSYEKKNGEVTTGAISLTFVASTKKITRGAGSFVTDGFTEGTIVTTNATLNPGPFTVTAVTALEITVSETVVNEGPVTKTAVGQAAFTGTGNDWFSTAVTLDSGGNDLYVLTNGVDAVQKWDGSAGNFAPLGGLTAIQARSLVVFKNRLILGHTIESGTRCPRRVRWPIAGDPETWTGTGSGFVELTETPDWVVGFALLKDRLFILKERSIWELVYVGGTTVFIPELRLGAVGGFTPNVMTSLGDELVFLGSDDIYFYDGFSIESLGPQIRGLLYDTETKIINSAKVNRACAAYIEELKEYWLAIPTQGEVPDLVFKYNFDTKSWVKQTLEVTAFGFYTVPVGVTWIDLTGTWSAQTWIWLDKPLSSAAPTTLIGTSTGYVKEDDRITKSSDTMIFETKDFLFEHASRIVECRVQAKGGPFDLFYSADKGVTWTLGGTLQSSSQWTEYTVPFNLTTQTVRFRITTTAEDLEIKWVEPWYIPRKRSASLTHPS